MLYGAPISGVRKKRPTKAGKVRSEKTSIPPLALPATTHAERSGKMSALKNVSNNIVSAKKSLCSVSSLVSWQQFLTPLKAQKEACDHIIKTADAFGDKIQATVSYIENEQALMKIITASTGSQDKITEAVWDTQTTTWQGATDSLKKLSVQTSFAPVKDSAITDAQAIEAAWQGLIAAHKAKDKTKYLEAQAQLAQAYGALGAIAAQSTQQFLSVANSLQTAYKDAFSSSMV